MNIANDAPGVDYVTYFTEQLPRDLAQMAALRDELAVRQGALEAAKNALLDRNAAAQELSKANAVAADVKADAKALYEDAKATLDDAKATEKEVKASSKAATEELAARENAVAKRESDATSQANLLNKQQVTLEQRMSAVAQQEDFLKTRVKAFQDKVASISA